MPGSNGTTRLPNKVQWCLADITAAARRNHRYLAAIADRVDDPVVLGLIIELQREMSEILMHSINARHNTYLEHPLDDQSAEDIIAALDRAGLIPARRT
jgi:hypothetical protein